MVASGYFVSNGMCHVFIATLLLVMDIGFGRLIDTKDIYFDINSDVTLTCATNSSNASFFWTRSRDSCPLFDKKINRDCKGYNRLEKEDAGKSLRISNSSLDDVGNYTCDITIKDPQQISTTVILLKVRKPPTNITIDNTNVNGIIHAKEGQRIHLLCKVNSGTPKETLVWLQNGKVLRNDTINSSVEYTFIPKRRHDGLQYTCQATQTGFESVQKTVTLVVMVEQSTTDNTNTKQQNPKIPNDNKKLVLILICVCGLLFVCLVMFVIYHYVDKRKRGDSNQQRQKVMKYNDKRQNQPMTPSQEPRYNTFQPNTGKSESIYVEVEINPESDDEDKRFRIKGSYANLVQ